MVLLDAPQAHRDSQSGLVLEVDEVLLLRLVDDRVSDDVDEELLVRFGVEGLQHEPEVRLDHDSALLVEQRLQVLHLLVLLARERLLASLDLVRLLRDDLLVGLLELKVIKIFR